MANWKGPLAVVLNAYDLTSFVTASTKESLLQNRDFASGVWGGGGGGLGLMFAGYVPLAP